MTWSVVVSGCVETSSTFAGLQETWCCMMQQRHAATTCYAATPTARQDAWMCSHVQNSLSVRHCWLPMDLPSSIFRGSGMQLPIHPGTAVRVTAGRQHTARQRMHQQKSHMQGSTCLCSCCARRFGPSRLCRVGSRLQPAVPPERKQEASTADGRLCSSLLCLESDAAKCRWKGSCI